MRTRVGITGVWAGLVLLSLAVSAWADSITGADWIVHFNLPDQNSGAVGVGEYDIRNALLARINQLGPGDEGTLATYTFSGNTASAGAAGPILLAMSNALARGAAVRFIADRGINLSSNYWPGISLASLAVRPGNSLVLSQDDSSFGIMHDKLGVFRYGGTNRWVFVTSWNFTGGASISQWNVALEIRNDALYAAYSNETAQLLAGRFHDDPAKSHAQDGALFRLEQSWNDGWVRVAPYPDGYDGGHNAMTEICTMIAEAQKEIVFGLNSITLSTVQEALVAAADRGVLITGALPLSNYETPADASYAIYTYLTNAAHYTSTNQVHFVRPYSRANGSTYDAGETDLIHAKYMVIDPWGSRPILIHGSANWTYSAMGSTNYNDENIVFLRHAPLARLFYAQFKRMTGIWTNRADFWCEASLQGQPLQVEGWVTDGQGYSLEASETLASGWQGVAGISTGGLGRFVFSTNALPPAQFYRLRKL